MKKSHGALRKSATNCAVGGPIKGKGTGTSDDVPIMASNGEFMIKAKAAKVIGPEVLEALNEIADKPDEKDSKAEAMREYGKGSESETHEAAEDAVEGMKCGGAIKKMAGGGYVAKEIATGVPHMEAAGYVDEAEKRAQMLAQIPTGGTGTGPTPQPDPTQSASGTELGRNVNNAIGALAPLSGGTALVRGASRLGAALGGSATAGKIATGVAQSMPYAVPAAGAVGLGIASSQSPAQQGTPAAAVQPAGALPRYSPAMDSQKANLPVQGGDIPTPTVPVNVQGTDGKSYLPGVVSAQDRIQSDAAINSVMGRRGAEAPSGLRVPAGGGAIPKTNADVNINKLASDGAARDTVNSAWAQRGAGIQAVSDGKGGVTLTNSTAPEKMQYTDMQGKPTNDYKATNQYAEGMDQREKLLESAKGLPTQYEKEVAQAQAINEAGRRMNLEYDLKNGNAKEREAAKLILQGIDSTEKDKRSNSLATRGQDITAQAQAVQAGALRANQKLAQDKFVLEQAKDSRDSTSASLDHKARQQLFDAQQEMLNAGDDPVKQKAAERKLIALSRPQPNDQYAYAPGGQVIDPTTGQTVTQAGVIFNKATGQTVQQGQQMKSAPPAKALEMLKANPKLAAEFDAKYGPGASAQYLAKK